MQTNKGIKQNVVLDNLPAAQNAMLTGSHFMAISSSHKLRENMAYTKNRNLMKYMVLLSLVILVSACNSTNVKNQAEQQDSKDTVNLEEFCKTNPCRKNSELNFLTDNGRVEQVLEIYWPVVQGDQISLLPGEKVFIEASLQNGKFMNLIQVQKNTNPDKTIVFDFQQMEDKVDMTLSVKNPFSNFMKFHLNMIDFQGNLHETSSCPVMAGGSVYKMWPHAIPELVVSDIRTLIDTESMSCEY